MGILDDAIREHLELKRQHGADSDDVERLEKEAFGPPTRPGDPEFDTSESQAAGAAGPAPAAPESAGSEDPTTVAPAASAAPAPASDVAPEREAGGSGIFDAESAGDDDWLASLEDVVEPPTLEPTSPGLPTESLEQPLPPRSQGSDSPETSETELPPPVAESAPAEAEAPSEPAPDAGPETDEELTPAEQARLEHADLGDTVAHQAIPDPAAGPDTAEEPAPSEPTTDPGAVTEPPEPPETEIFDTEDDLDLDLELDIDEAEEASAPRSDDPAAGTGPAVEDPQVGRSVPLEPESEEFEIEEPASDELELPPEPRQSTDEFEADDAEEDDLEDEDEDLLEETPDFLQDTPEGDRLWFEQSGPKDFDFEEDDKD